MQMARKLTIMFVGMIAAHPHQGGATWAVLQYVLGFKRLGHEVLFVEPISRSALQPASCGLQESANAKYFRSVVSEFEIGESSVLILDGTRQTVGMSYDQIHAFAGGADVLINVSGMLSDHHLISGIPLRVYLDLDPAFVQLWHATQGIDMRLDAHNRFVTVGLSIGTPSCAIPTCGRDWITTLQPVVLAYWPTGSRIRYDALTTVGNWRGYGSIEYDGKFYGQKAHSLREFLSLPQRTKEHFTLAMAIHSGETTDIVKLSENGWTLISPFDAAGNPWSYREFIQTSKAEVGIAKSGYVNSRCGWFSDRSACYLASGRPVIAQDTGFSQHLPVGDGLFAFTTIDDAVRCIEVMNEDYERHSLAARKVAETYFDSERVLFELLKRLGAL
jgi:hypothetical protein